MAKSSALARRFGGGSARPVIITMPASRARRAGRRVVAVARRGGRGLRRAGRAAGGVPALSLAIGAAGVGFAEAKGMLNFIPTVGGSRTFTLALAGYAATRLVRHPMIRAAGYAMLAVGSYDFGRKQAGAVSGWGDDISGDDV